MDGIEDDDGYSDDDLDALPVHAFHELQQDAIRSTQQPGAQQHQLPSPKQKLQASNNGYLGSLDRLSLDNDGDLTQQQPSSDYGDFDDEMLDGEIFDTAVEQPSILQNHVGIYEPARGSTQGGSWKPQRYPAPQTGFTDDLPQRLPTQRPTSVPNINRGPNHQIGPGRVLPSTSEAPKPTPPSVVSTCENPAVLQAKVEELARENERLKRDYDAAKIDVFAKTGEIAIVRANTLKEKQEEAKRLAQERKLRAEELANCNAEVQRYKAELQKISTDKAFIENDLARETEQRRGLQKDAKTGGKSGLSKPTGKANTVATPKKNRDGPFGDGFDGEIQTQSPSKLALRSKPVTPKAGAKRKRKPVDNSPVKPLQLRQTKKDATVDPSKKTADQQSFDASAVLPANEAPKPVIQISLQEDHRFDVRISWIVNAHADSRVSVYSESPGSSVAARWEKICRGFSCLYSCFQARSATLHDFP